MKKLISFLLIPLVSLAISCGQTLNDAADGKLSPQDRMSAAYSYLNFMYKNNADSTLSGKAVDEPYGKQLNDEVLQGAVYDMYRDQVQKILNVKLRFPLNPVVAAGSDPAQWINTPWYDTVPSELTEFLTQSKDHANLANGLYDFLQSGDGQALARTLLNEAEGQFQKYIDYAANTAVNKLEGAALDVIKQAFGVDSLPVLSGANSDLIGAFSSVSNGMYFLQGANMLMNFYYFNKISGQLEQIQETLQRISQQLAQIQQSLTVIEAKIDELLNVSYGTAIDQHRVDIDYANTYISTVFNNLEGQSTVDQASYLDNIFKLTDKFQDVIQQGYQSAVDCQEYIVSSDYDGKYQDFPNINIYHRKTTSNAKLVADLTPKLIKPSFAIFNADTMKGMSLQDILTIKRLSLMRLQLADRAYSGTTLLQFRASKASNDMNNLLTPIKKALNDCSTNLNSLTATIKSNVNNNFPALDFGDFYDPGPDFNDYYSILYYNSPVCYKLDTDTYIFLNPELTSGIVDSVSNPLYVGYGGYSVLIPFYGINEFRNEIKKRLQEIADNGFSEEYKQTMIIAAAEIAEWEIQLRAHMAAGE